MFRNNLKYVITKKNIIIYLFKTTFFLSDPVSCFCTKIRIFFILRDTICGKNNGDGRIVLNYNRP